VFVDSSHVQLPGMVDACTSDVNMVSHAAHVMQEDALPFRLTQILLVSKRGSK